MPLIQLSQIHLLLLLASFLFGQENTPSKTISVRVAAISFVPRKFDLQGNANRLEKAFRQAAKGNAKIAVAPEGALDGYVVNEVIAGKAPAEKIKQAAISMKGPIIKRFQQLARELKMCLVFGCAEQIKNEVFNCAVFIDNEGEIAGKYHKMQFAEGYHPDWWFNRLGEKSRAFDTPFGRCGMLICNDRWNPQLARIPVLVGARFLIIPAYGSRSKAQDEAVLNRGIENGAPVIEANVGVTLIVNQSKIASVDRRVEGITFGEINIPPPRASQPQKRDQLEREFLLWRTTEMQKRFKQTKQRLKKHEK